MESFDILRRIEEGEGHTTELKRGLGDLSAIGKAVCAFANTEGGVVILGVDNSKAIVGVREPAEKVRERLTSFLHTGCSSPVSANEGCHEDPQGRIHWLYVPRQRGLEPLRYDGRVWIRRGRSSVEPSPTELQELYNVFGYILTEERAIQAANVDHIDLPQFQAYLRAQGLDIETEPQPGAEDDLRSRGVLTEIDGTLCATLYGILGFGKNPQQYSQTQNFYMQCAAYAGEDRASEVLQVADAKGRVDEQVARAVGWFAGLGKFETYHELLREDRHLLPIPAIREALVNAAVHRDYSLTGSPTLFEVFADRVDVTSAGALPNHATVESVRNGGLPRSRNEWLANLMLVLGFFEKRGRGWPLMRRMMHEFNGTEPDLTAEANSRQVKVTFHL